MEHDELGAIIPAGIAAIIACAIMATMYGCLLVVEWVIHLFE